MGVVKAPLVPTCVVRHCFATFCSGLFPRNPALQKRKSFPARISFQKVHFYLIYSHSGEEGGETFDEPIPSWRNSLLYPSRPPHRIRGEEGEGRKEPFWRREEEEEEEEEEERKSFRPLLPPPPFGAIFRLPPLFARIFSPFSSATFAFFERKCAVGSCTSGSVSYRWMILCMRQVN